MGELLGSYSYELLVSQLITAQLEAQEKANESVYTLSWRKARSRGESAGYRPVEASR